MPYQTVANSNAYLLGSCRVSIPSSSAAYIDLGSARGVKITESFDSMMVETDNTPPVIVGAKKQTVTVEGNLLELDFRKMRALRGYLDSATWSTGSTTATLTFNSGGSTTGITPKAFYLTHYTDSTSLSIVTTIYYASITEGFNLPFVSDDKTEVMEIPFKIKGVCQSTRTVGSQLMNIVDLRSGVYSTTYFSTSI
jgi:hypothetical protein